MDFFRKFWRSLKHYFLPSRENAYRPHLLGRKWLIGFLVVIFAVEGFFVASLIAREAGINFLAAVVPGEVIALTNTQRHSSSVGTLAENKLLDAAAQAKAQDMAAKGYFSHVGPDGKEPWTWISGAGYNYVYAGENLAVRFVDSSDVINAWMASPTHRANIVKGQYTEIGVAVADGTYQGQPVTFVVQYFASSAVARSASGDAKVGKPASAVQPKVLGTEVGPVSPSEATSLTNSIEREVAKIFAEPRSSATWLLGWVAALLLILLALAFFVHIHIQPLEMLMSGASVAMAAVLFIGLNTQLFSASITTQNDITQSASVAAAVAENGVIITASAAAIEP